MSSHVSLEEFAPQCPTGGKWYACGPQTKTKFVGCCETDSDPCEIMCPDGSLKPGGFNAEYHGQFVNAACGAGVDFYTCDIAQENTTFWGCCQSNPCQPGGCPSTDLEPAIMNRDDQFEAFNATGISTESSSTVGTSSTSSATPSQDTAGKTESKTPVAAIAGGTAGGAVAIALIIGLVIFWLRRSKKSKERQGDYMVTGSRDEETLNTATSGANNGKHQSYQSQSAFLAHTPPPSYTSPAPGSEPRREKQYYGYTHEQPHEPQELPAETFSHTPGPHKDEAPTQEHPSGPSELPGQSVPDIAELNSAPSPTETTAHGLGLEGMDKGAART